MLMMEQPRERKMRDSERVLKVGPSMQMRVPDGCTIGEVGPERSLGTDRVWFKRAERGGSKGSARDTCPTRPPSKKVKGRTWRAMMVMVS